VIGFSYLQFFDYDWCLVATVVSFDDSGNMMTISIFDSCFLTPYHDVINRHGLNTESSQHYFEKS